MSELFPVELQRRIERAFAAGEFEAGARCTVADASRYFGAAETDIATVLHAARRKGLVEPVEGREAAFRFLGLADPAFESVFTHTASAGFKPRSEVRSIAIEPAPRLVAAMLHLEEGDLVYRYVRTRYVDDEVLANQTNYIPYNVCPGLEREDLAHRSFQRLLEKEYHVVLTDMQEEFELSTATEEDARALGVPPGGLVLLVERLALSRTGWPIVWANLRIRPDRFDYVRALWPEAAALIKDAQ